MEDCERSIQIDCNYEKAYKKKASALCHLLKFSEAVSTMKAAVAQNRNNQTLKNELEDFESYESNYNRYLDATRTEDYSEVMSCISYLLSKFPTMKTLKVIKTEALAKTGATDEALALIKTMQNSVDPDLSYLKGIIELYSGDSSKAKKFFMEGLQLDPDHIKCK